MTDTEELKILDIMKNAKTGDEALRAYIQYKEIEIQKQKEIENKNLEVAIAQFKFWQEQQKSNEKKEEKFKSTHPIRYKVQKIKKWISCRI